MGGAVALLGIGNQYGMRTSTTQATTLLKPRCLRNMSLIIIAGPPALLLSCHERVRTQEGGLLGEVMEVVRWDDGGMICSVQLADGTLIDGSAIPGQTFCRA